MHLDGMTDEGVVKLMASRIRHHRLNANLSQEEVAKEAGVGITTYINFENGHNTSLKIKFLVAILRKLDLLDNIDILVPEPEISPRQVAKLHGKKRQRASSQKRPEESSDKEDLGW